jgi:hypothetical protein
LEFIVRRGIKMKRKLVVLLTILTLLTTSSYAIGMNTKSNTFKITSGVEPPEWRIGDSWVYTVDADVNYYDELNLQAHLTEVRMEVTDITSTEYKIGLTGYMSADGSYAGFSGGMDQGQIKGGTISVRKSDLAIVGLDDFKASGKASVFGIPLPITASGTLSFTQLTPINYFDFPLEVGKTWTRSAIFGNISIQVDVGSIIHEDVPFDIYEVPDHLECVGTESISVGGTSFECYKIVGDMGTSSIMWYSPDIGNFVKAEYRDIDLFFEEGNDLHYDINSIDVICTGYGKVSDPPETPSAPSGPSKGDLGESYSFSASSTDPDGDKIKYVFDWGDETTSETSFHNSGQSGSTSHKWNNGGTFEVRVKAVDINGAESEWSGPTYIDIQGTRGSINLTIKILKVAEQEDIDPWYKLGADWSYRLSIFDGDGWITRQYDCPGNKNTYEPKKSYTFPIKTGSPQLKLKLWDRDTVLKNPLGGYVDYHDLADVSSHNGNGINNDLPDDLRGAIYHGVYKVGGHKLSTIYGQNNDLVEKDGSKYITSGRLDGSEADDVDSNDARIIFEITDDYETLRNAKITYPADGAIYSAGQEIDFKATVEKGLQPYKWEWDFGDGTTSNKQNPTKVYTEGGWDRWVQVRVTDEAEVTIESETIRVRINDNRPPDTPTKPSGPNTAKLGIPVEYSTYSKDWENDKMAFGWDWDGDDIVDEWDDNNGDYYYSTDDNTIEHIWNMSGTKKVKVKAKDQTGLESEWSEELNVIVRKSRSYNLIERILDFFENHPYLFPVLRQLFGL